MKRRLTYQDHLEIANLYVKQLVPMIEIARRFDCSRMAIWKALNRQNIDTTKKTTALVPTSCDFCNRPIKKFRCHFRKYQHHFCNAQCASLWKTQENKNYFLEKMKTYEKENKHTPE